MIFNQEISTWFLVFGLIFPRLTLLYCWFGYNTIPLNNVPFFFDVIGAVVVPRFLIAIYIYQNMGNCVWMWVYIITGILTSASITTKKNK